MEDATKATARNLFDTQPDPESGAGEIPGQDGPEGCSESTRSRAAEDAGVPVVEKALDRWFMEQKGSKRVPKRLDVPNEALVTSAGPLKITGNITFIDEDGEVTHANHLTLCRCGASNNKPLCDDRHLEIEFFDMGNINQASECMPMNRPQTVTITAVKDGPLKYRGYLRVHNRKGQECTTMVGALCRCGRSTKKPFCDCQ
jgi:CDGSH-type Zn-finger protein